MGAVKGMVNGDLVQTLFGNLLSRGNNSTGPGVPNIPWPRGFSDALNQMESELTRVMVNLQQLTRLFAGRGIVENSKIFPIVPAAPGEF